MAKKMRHYEESALIPASADNIFALADDPANFSSHMNKSSWMMGGGKMETGTDDGKGQKIGSHIRMNGKILGINLFLDEVVTKHEPPLKKEWQTVGNLNLLVIGSYKLGFEINPDNNKSNFKVYIDYNLPKPPLTRLLGLLLGNFYAKWCVNQMINGVKLRFNNKN